MTQGADDRIGVVIGPATSAGPDDALLLPAGVAAATGAGVVVSLPAGAAGIVHARGCACCLPRGALAETLGRLFLARARGEVAAFRRLVAPLEGEAAAALSEALVSDRLLAARFRLEGEAAPPG